MTRPALDGFWQHGEWRELEDPDGPPTGRQLARLNALGMLELVFLHKATHRHSPPRGEIKVRDKARTGRRA